MYTVPQRLERARAPPALAIAAGRSAVEVGLGPDRSPVVVERGRRRAITNGSATQREHDRERDRGGAPEARARRRGPASTQPAPASTHDQRGGQRDVAQVAGEAGLRHRRHDDHQHGRRGEREPAARRRDSRAADRAHERDQPRRAAPAAMRIGAERWNTSTNGKCGERGRVRVRLARAVGRRAGSRPSPRYSGTNHSDAAARATTSADDAARRRGSIQRQPQAVERRRTATPPAAAARRRSRAGRRRRGGRRGGARSPTGRARRAGPRSCRATKLRMNSSASSSASAAITPAERPASRAPSRYAIANASSAAGARDHAATAAAPRRRRTARTAS